jgi:hypothetical protein
MGKAKQVIAAPIMGLFGQEINVGDTVVLVTTGFSHRVNVRKGKYVGYVESTGSYSRRARVEVDSTRSFQVKPDGTEFNWKKDYDSKTWSTVKDTLTRRTEPCVVKATLQLNRIWRQGIV